MVTGTIQREKIYVYDTCSLCGDANVLVYLLNENLLCAECIRKERAKLPKFIQPCDRCGQDNAFRDPTHRRNEYLCSDCHEKDGFTVTTSIVKRAINAMQNSIINKTGEKIVCSAAGYGSRCDENLKPRSAWGGKILCNEHGKKAPKPNKS